MFSWQCIIYAMNKDIKSALLESKLFDYFESLPPSHQKEYLNWINDSKKEETKQKRTDKMLEMLKAKYQT
jgi:uncharacterized protein YdeI (YjbR/CyaY-like superfamily)